MSWHVQPGAPVWIRYGNVGSRAAIVDRLGQSRVRLRFVVGEQEGCWRKPDELMPRVPGARPPSIEEWRSYEDAVDAQRRAIAEREGGFPC